MAAGEETNPVKSRTPLTPEQVQRVHVLAEIDDARMDAYDAAIGEIDEALNQLRRAREQIEASARARAKLVADWPKTDTDEPVAYVPARGQADGRPTWTFWQHRCGRVLTSTHEPTAPDECRCDDSGPVLPGDWRQMYVRAGGER